VNSRSLVALAVTAGALAVPHAAGAADLHVTAGAGATTCAQDDPCSLGQAITIADIVSNADTIHVTGPLAHTGALDLSNSPIALIGSGRGPGGTVIDAGGDALRVGAGSSASAVSVRGAVLLESAGAIDHVDVVSGSYAVRVEPIAGGEFATIRDSHVAGHDGIVDDSGADGVSAFQVERTTVEATRYGIYVYNANATIANSVIRARTPGAIGVHASNLAGIAVDGSTIDGGGSGDFGVRTGTGADPTIVLTGSIVRGFGTDLFANARPSGYGLSVSTSDYATSSGASVGDLGGNVSADPHWLDAANGDYRLAAGSPLIDRGAARAAAQGETDRAGDPRVVDGDGDGATARDIGAYERQLQAQPQPSITAPPTTATQQQTTFAVTVGRLRLNRRGQSSATVGCSVKPCTVKLVLATTGKRPHTLARASGRAGKVTFQLSRSARAYVKRHRIRRVALTATATDISGRRTKARRIATLR
jgi:hypothetical protein